MATDHDRLVEEFASDLGTSEDEANLYLISGNGYSGRGVPAAIWDCPVGGS